MYAAEISRIPAYSQNLIEQNNVVISPMVCLELQYLHEIKRIRVEANSIVQSLTAAIGLQVSRASFYEVAVEAMMETWTRDPFDRMIVANAKADSAPLVTKDEIIHSHFQGARWKE